MGLRQGDSSHPPTRGASAWLLPALIAAGAGILEIFGTTARSLLSYDRPALLEAELWRLITGHFVHLGVSHLLLNIAGLLLIWYLISASFSRRQWLLIMLTTIAGIDLGFWFLEPQLVWYVGLSGLLHGLLAAGVVAGIRARRPDAWILAVVLIGKLTYEQLAGPLPGSVATAGGAVIVAAHLYGAIAGGIAAGLAMISVHIRVRGQPPI